MFHRVKSETQKVQNSQSTDNDPKDQQASQPENNPASEKSQETAQKSAQTNQDATAKEQPAMTDNQNENTQSNSAQASAAQANNENNNSPAPASGRSQPQAQSQPAAPQTPGAPFAGSSAYPGFNPAQGGASSATKNTSRDSEEDRRLVIGKGISVSGEIEACDYLMVEGTIEAALKGARILEVTETGTFYGTVEIDEASVAGRFEGDLTVNGRLTVQAGGIITGSVSYRELEVQAGASIEGKLTPLKGGEVQQQKPAPKSSAGSSQKAAAQQKSQKADKPQPANSDGQLFASAASAAE